MTTLHIEHPISEYTTWRAAFDRFEPFRADAGVIDCRIHRPIDNDHYIVIQLDFHRRTQAAAFLTTLRDNIWNSATTSPALRGEPRVVILDPADDTPHQPSE